MYLLPGDFYTPPVQGCGEKITSYLALAGLGLPVLNSAIISNDEIERLGREEYNKIGHQLKGKKTMLRYIYRQSCHNVKNGGKVVEIARDSLIEEIEPKADMWLLESSRREDNLYCCNICLDKNLMNLHIEILGKGFDISDINKGQISPHEVIDIPYPICYGAYGDWWKWAKFHWCTQKEYEESITLRRKRLYQLNSKRTVNFDKNFKPARCEFIEKIFSAIEKIETNSIWERTGFYNLSCSFEKNGRMICWDIQTPKGKMNAYI